MRVTSRLDYCNSLLYGLPSNLLAKLQQVQNAAATLIHRAPRFCHITPLLVDLHRLDIKSRIDETAKYIRPRENTTDYAYMFIPADGLYQDLLNSRVGTLQINSRDLVSYAYTKKVMIVSPMSLFPMLQITVKALHNLKVEKSIEDILKNVEKLSSHLNSYKIFHDKLGNTIGTVVNHYNKSSQEFKKIDKDVTKLSGGTHSIGFDRELLEKPQLDEDN